MKKRIQILLKFFRERKERKPVLKKEDDVLFV